MKPRVGPWSERESRWLRPAALGLLAAYVALSLYLLWRSAVIAAFSDEFNWAASWYQLQDDHHWLVYLLAPHNLNRLVWTRLLVAFDMAAGGGTNAPLILSGVLGLAVMATVLGVQAARAAPAPLRLPFGALAAMLVLTAGNVLDASLPINTTYAHAAGFAALAIVLAEGAPQSAFGWRGLGALVCAAGSAFGSGAGLALWPVMAWGALRRRDWRWLALVLAAGVVFVGLYLRGQGSGPGAAALPAVQAPQSALVLALNYLTLPWTRLAPRFAWIPGIAVAVAASALVLLKGGPKARPSERVACALILFTLGTAVMAGLGRSGLQDPYNVPIRYGLLVAPLQIGFLMLAAPLVSRLWRRRPQLAEALVAAALAVVLVQDVAFAAKAITAADALRGRVAMLYAGIVTPDMVNLTGPVPGFAEGVMARLRHDHLFQHELHLKRAAAPR
jgi:hypothetical protein